MAGNRKSGTSKTVKSGNKGSALRPETIVSGQTTGIQAGQGSVGTAGTMGPVQEPPATSMLRPVGNLFSESRAGETVVRPDDLLAMRVQLINVGRKPGSRPPRLHKIGSGVAYLILHHPPQSIADEVFYETPAAGAALASTDRPPKASQQPTPTPPTDVNVAPPPIRARAAGESRLVFEWPNGFECNYSLEGLLQAAQTLKMNVPPGARPRAPRFQLGFGLSLWPQLKGVGSIKKRASVRDGLVSTAALGTRVSTLNGFSLRQTQIAQRGGAAVEATLLRRLSDLSSSSDWSEVVVQPPFQALPFKPKPALPGPHQTALEIPWRLIVSPHNGEQWQHARLPVTSPGTSHTELWHTRLLGNSAAGGSPIEAPHADPSRTLRAVWATTGHGQKAMQADFPQGFTELPGPDNGNPPNFLSTLTDYDRYQFSHLSANYANTNYLPEPIDTRLLMLSSLGGWLDCRAEWEPPGLDVESWVHRATMGRDHYVRVVYRGVLFPFGHKAVLIKVSERKFHGALPGNPAYLRQRMFMVVRERERRYDDAALLRPYGANNQRVQNEFPFTHVRMLTAVTPDLSQPKMTEVEPGLGQLLFWPATGPGNNPEPFRFRMVATDLDGRQIQFDLPLIFMSNTMASPRYRENNRLKPLHNGSLNGLMGAAQTANKALNGWLATQTPEGMAAPNANDRTVAQFKGQRVAMALSAKAGDTAVEIVHMTFGAHVPRTSAPQSQASKDSQAAFKAYTPKLEKPMFFPRVVRAQARIGAMAQLTGSSQFNQIRWNSTYAERGFDTAANKGEVFLDLPQTQDMARLDFSKQGDRSGGFVMPNLNPSALSRALGPTAGAVGDVLNGKVKPTGFFPPGATELPLPLLFGCIPLSAVISEVSDLLDNLDKTPKFASEASTKVESFFNDLMRLYQFVGALAEQPASLAEAALAVVKATLNDLVAQAAVLGAAQATLVRNKIDTALALLDAIRSELSNLAAKSFESANPLASINLQDALDAPAGNGKLRAALNEVKSTVAGIAQAPAGLRQQVNAVVAQALLVLDALALVSKLYTDGKALFDTLKNLLDNPAPGQSIGELITKPAELAPKVQAVADRLGAVKADVETFPLLDGPPRKALVEVIGTVQQALSVVPDLLQLLENLLGEELVVRFDWKPEIKSWGFSASNPLFVVNDKHGFIVAVEARMKKSGGAPKIQVLCGLRHFDLRLIAPATFIELNFEKIEFTVNSAAKMNVDVILSDIKFVGPLSFVETLRDLIPLDGFSDPPYLDITAQGIDAGFNVALPTIACGVLNLSNVSLGAGFTVPFIGQPLSVRFNFCTREQPFHLTVYCFGGGGFFGVTLDPHGVQILEAAFEFGAAIAVDFGVASGGVSVMAGIYFRMEADAASLTGYFRLEGHVDVLGLITASLELYLELRYEFETGKAVGRATLTIEVEVLIFSGSVTITCEKKFAGSNGDPTFRQLLGLSTNAALPLVDELAAIQPDTTYGWRDYCEAFA